jgi:hypothetical protein
MVLFLFGVALVVAALYLNNWLKLRRAKRAEFIRTFILPKGLYDSLRKKHPSLSLKDCELVGRGLRQFFLAYLTSGRKYVSMPSQVVDDLWHEYILHTRSYQVFCEQAFGRFLHHLPAATLSTTRATDGESRLSNEGLRRCWFFACKDELINPKSPSRLPLLFALDAKLAIAGGFQYLADCTGVVRQGNHGIVHCGGDFGSASFDGSTDGFGDSASASSSGDGGDGGGGGCGGD